MENLRDFQESDPRAPEVLKTVFMDTSLDTYLGISVSDTVTVSDLIEKIKVEHPKCFPAMGEIRVHAVKVKRKGNLYHLSDSMLIKSAFGEGAKNWFLSVDASCLNKQHRTQHFSGEHDNQLALPWATDSPSDGEPSKGLSIIHQSSMPPITNMQSVNQKVYSVNQSTLESSDRELKGKAEDRYSNDNHLKVLKSDSGRKLDLHIHERHDAVEEEMASKKRIHDAQHECSFEAALDHVPASKKQRKSRRKGSDVKSLDGGTNLISDTSNVKHKAETLGLDFAAKDILQGVGTTSSGLAAEPLDIDDSRTSPLERKGKKEKKDREGVEHSTVDHDQPVIVISSQLGDASLIKSKSKKKKRDREGEVVALSSYLGDAEKEHFFNENVNSSKNYPDKMSGASALGNDIHQEALTATILSSQKGEHDGPVHEVVDGNEVPSSQMRTFVADHDAGNVVGDTSVPQIAPECFGNGTEGFSKDMDNGNNDVIPSSHQSLSSNNQKYEGNYEEEGELPPNLDYEVKLREIGAGKKKKKAKKSSARNKDESSVKHTNVVVPSTGPDPAFDDHLVNERKNNNSILSSDERNTTDVIPANASGEGDNGILNDARTSLPSDADTGRNKRKEKKCRTSASRIGDQLVAKSADIASNEAKNRDESSVKHTNMSDIPSTGRDPAFDGHLVKEGRNDDSILSRVEKTKTDVSPAYAGKEGDSVVLNDAEISLPARADTGRHKRKKKNRGTFTTKYEDELVAKPDASDEAKKKDVSSVKHTNMSDFPSTGPDPAFDDRLVNERKNDNSILSRDEENKTDVIPPFASGEGDNFILSDADISLPSEADTGRHKRKQKNHGTSASRNKDQLAANSADNGSIEAKKKDESSVKHTNMSDIHSTGCDPAFDGHLVNERRNDSILSHDEKNKTDVFPAYARKEGDSVILNDADISLPSEADTGRHKRKKKKMKMSW